MSSNNARKPAAERGPSAPSADVEAVKRVRRLVEDLRATRRPQEAALRGGQTDPLGRGSGTRRVDGISDRPPRGSKRTEPEMHRKVVPSNRQSLKSVERP